MKKPADFADEVKAGRCPPRSASWPRLDRASTAKEFDLGHYKDEYAETRKLLEGKAQDEEARRPTMKSRRWST